MTHDEKDKVLAEQKAKIDELMGQLNVKDSEQAKVVSDKDAQIAELLAKVKAMEAEKQNEAEDTAEPAAEKTVRIRLYKDERIVNDQEVFVNGHPYLIQRGVEVDAPESVASVLHNKQVMQNQIAAYNAKHADK